MRVRFLILALAALATPAMAQHGLTSPHFSPRPAGFFRSGLGVNSFARGGFFYPYTLPVDGFYADALNSGYPVASQPPVVILQAPPADRDAEPHPMGEPVMIELQGDHYVRLSGPATNGGVMLDVQPARRAESSSTTPNVVQPKIAAQKSAVLVFRDGHREDVSDYVISNGTLYAHTSYYTSGAWTKNIDLAALDVPETVNLNQSRGVKFQLPNAANEVVVGP